MKYSTYSIIKHVSDKNNFRIDLAQINTKKVSNKSHETVPFRRVEYLKPTLCLLIWMDLIVVCAPGFQIIGPEERVCQASGLWSNHEPYCKRRGEPTLGS